MRNTDALDADQPIEGSSLTISVYYTMASPSALETDGTTPLSPEPAIMSDSIGFLSSPSQFYDDREILYASSISATFNSSAIAVSDRPVLPPGSSPLNANGLNDRDEPWRSLNQRYFEAESPTNERAIALRYFSAEPVMMDPDVQQSKQFDSTPVPSTPLSTNSNIRSPGDELQKNVPAARTRTRRRAVNLVVEPPNPYGRKGKPRCERCRDQRQRCVYASLELPCETCQERGIMCKNKTWPPKSKYHSPQVIVSAPIIPALEISRISAFPDLALLNPIEWRFLKKFHSFQYPSLYRPLLSLTSRLGSHGAVELYHVTDVDCYSSIPFRSAVFVLMSYLKNNDPSDTSGPSDTSLYIAKYRREVRTCLNNGSLLELVYASYVLTIYSIVGGESVQMAMMCCDHFCKYVVELSRKQNGTDDWIEMLWRDVLSALYYVHRDQIVFMFSLDCVVQWEKLVGTSYCLLVSEEDIANLPLSMTTEKICHKVKSLSIYMQFYLDLFLIRVNFTEQAAETKVARDCLHSILDRIIRLVSHLSNISDYIHHAYRMEPGVSPTNDDTAANAFLHFAAIEPRALKHGTEPLVRDTALALLYAFARLVKNMLELTVNVDEKVSSEIYNSGIAICRLCANLSIDKPMQSWIVKRSLFWAGIMLTESKFPQEHSSIRSRLQECIRGEHHWRTFAILGEEEKLLDELFREANKCASTTEIWKVQTASLSLFYYTNILTTWFFGLNLARFEDKPYVGRSLEITT